MSIVIPMQRGPYQNNGASPWFGLVNVGSAGLTMKLALDTGTNLFWVTSTYCMTAACTQAGRIRFDPSSSTTFKMVDSTPLKVDYGPWGSLQAQVGNDTMSGTGSGSAYTVRDLTFFIATDYSGQKFEEVDWDGCIGFPSADKYKRPDVSFFFEDLINSGGLGVNPVACVCFDTDFDTKTGTCELGGIDFSKCRTTEWVYLEYAPYFDKAIKGNEYAVDYIWTTQYASVHVGENEIASGKVFCVDTGSSRFKGDQGIMTAMKNAVTASKFTQPLTISAGLDSNGDAGQIVIGPDLYMQKIEKGDHAGETLPQIFEHLGPVADLVLVGSILLDQVYTIYFYEQTIDEETGKTVLSPHGVFLLNKINGPNIIQNKANQQMDLQEVFLQPDLLKNIVSKERH